MSLFDRMYQFWLMQLEHTCELWIETGSSISELELLKQGYLSWFYLRGVLPLMTCLAIFILEQAIHTLEALTHP